MQEPVASLKQFWASLNCKRFSNRGDPISASSQTQRGRASLRQSDFSSLRLALFLPLINYLRSCSHCQRCHSLTCVSCALTTYHSFRIPQTKFETYPIDIPLLPFFVLVAQGPRLHLAPTQVVANNVQRHLICTKFYICQPCCHHWCAGFCINCIERDKYTYRMN
jgi:hypothetical protein